MWYKVKDKIKAKGSVSIEILSDIAAESITSNIENT